MVYADPRREPASLVCVDGGHMNVAGPTGRKGQPVERGGTEVARGEPGLVMAQRGPDAHDVAGRDLVRW